MARTGFFLERNAAGAARREKVRIELVRADMRKFRRPESFNGILVLEEREVTQHWSWVESRWILISGQSRIVLELSHRLYSAAELSWLLRDCGFERVVAFGDLGGAPYDERANRLVLVARKT